MTTYSDEVLLIPVKCRALADRLQGPHRYGAVETGDLVGQVDATLISNFVLKRYNTVITQLECPNNLRMMYKRFNARVDDMK